MKVELLNPGRSFMFKGNKKDIRIIKEICSKCSRKSPKLRY